MRRQPSLFMLDSHFAGGSAPYLDGRPLQLPPQQVQRDVALLQPLRRRCGSRSPRCVLLLRGRSARHRAGQTTVARPTRCSRVSADARLVNIHAALQLPRQTRRSHHNTPAERSIAGTAVRFGDALRLGDGFGDITRLEELPQPEYGVRAGAAIAGIISNSAHHLRLSVCVG